MNEGDGELLLRCRTGDEGAWRELVSHHTRRVFTVAYHFTGRVDQAEDLTQEVFVKVYQNLDRYRAGDGDFPRWLMAVARHHAIDHYRSRREERLRVSADPERVERMASKDESPLAHLEREERARMIRQRLRSLPPALRHPVILHDIEGLPYVEIAQMLGLPVGTVKSRINRGRLELAKRMPGRPPEPRIS